MTRFGELSIHHRPQDLINGCDRRLPVSQTPRSQKRILVVFRKDPKNFMVYCNPLFCCVGFHPPKKNGSGFFAIATFFAFVGRKKTSGKALRNKNTSPMPLWCVFMHQTFVVKPLTNFLPRFVKFGRRFGHDFFFEKNVGNPRLESKRSSNHKIFQPNW